MHLDREINVNSQSQIISRIPNPRVTFVVIKRDVIVPRRGPRPLRPVARRRPRQQTTTTTFPLSKFKRFKRFKRTKRPKRYSRREPQISSPRLYITQAERSPVSATVQLYSPSVLLSVLQRLFPTTFCSTTTTRLTMASTFKPNPAKAGRYVFQICRIRHSAA